MKSSEHSNKSITLWQLFLTFFKVGAFTFGGGYAMIAILEEELISKKKWITERDMLDMIVIAESTPGVIAVNTATSVGYKTRGISGAIVATLGVVLPSMLLIYALSFAIQAFSDNVWYKAAFTGVRACVTILIINAFVKLFRQVDWNLFSAILFVVALWIAVLTSVNVIYLILCGAVFGICYMLAANHISRKRNLPFAESERLNSCEQFAQDEVEHNFDDPSAQKCESKQSDDSQNDLSDESGRKSEQASEGSGEERK